MKAPKREGHLKLALLFLFFLLVGCIMHGHGMEMERVYLAGRLGWAS